MASSFASLQSAWLCLDVLDVLVCRVIGVKIEFAVEEDFVCSATLESGSTRPKKCRYCTILILYLLLKHS